MSLATVIGTLMFAVLFAFVGMVLLATLRQIGDERRAAERD
jgi:hypothetical protein